MPLYEYQCDQCQQPIEVVQKFSDAPLESCLVCQGALKKVMSLGGFALKGSGWFTSDYKKPGPKSSD
jgi:putative FmdB family regulatory protein